MIIEVRGEHPQPRRIREALRHLGRGELIAYPTDTVYAVGCRLDDREAIARIQRLKADRGSAGPGLLSLIVPDLGSLAEWAVVEDRAYRVLRRSTPGPYTFVMAATRKVPKIMGSRQKTIGVRLPDSPVAVALAEALGGVIVTTTAKGLNGSLLLDPRSIEASYKGSVKVVLDTGPILPEPSTVVDLTASPPEILREGKGLLELMGAM